MTDTLYPPLRNPFDASASSLSAASSSAFWSSATICLSRSGSNVYALTNAAPKDCTTVIIKISTWRWSGICIKNRTTSLECFEPSRGTNTLLIVLLSFLATNTLQGACFTTLWATPPNRNSGASFIPLSPTTARSAWMLRHVFIISSAGFPLRTMVSTFNSRVASGFDNLASNSNALSSSAFCTWFFSTTERPRRSAKLCPPRKTCFGTTVRTVISAFFLILKALTRPIAASE